MPAGCARGVGEQVVDDLRAAAPVAEHERRLGRRARSAARVDGLGGLDRLGDDRVELDRLALERAALVEPGEQQQLVDQPLIRSDSRPIPAIARARSSGARSAPRPNSSA